MNLKMRTSLHYPRSYSKQSTYFLRSFRPPTCLLISNFFQCQKGQDVYRKCHYNSTKIWILSDRTIIRLVLLVLTWNINFPSSHSTISCYGVIIIIRDRVSVCCCENSWQLCWPIFCSRCLGRINILNNFVFLVSGLWFITRWTKGCSAYIYLQIVTRNTLYKLSCCFSINNFTL